MPPLLRLGLLLTATLLLLGGTVAAAIIKLTPYDPAATRQILQPALATRKLTVGAPVYVRIFKEPSQLELWLRAADGRYRLFKTYPICAWSGALGPKLREGDNQAPEGFYNITRTSLNPGSRFHLAFNLGFPNAYDRAHGRTGSALMVHGNCVSIGCYAMTDPAIEEIYTLIVAAFDHGQQQIPVHIFPFRFDAKNRDRHQDSPWQAFWQELQPAYRLFEETGQVPSVTVAGKGYQITSP